MSKHIVIILALVTLSASANDEVRRVHSPSVDQSQRQLQDQSQTQSVGTSVDASTSVRAFSLAGPVTQVQASDCWVPGKGRKRSWSILWGLVSVSGTLERDEDCWNEYLRQQRFKREVALEK